jgi:hypothetical protein
MDIMTSWELARMVLELSLGVSIKLFCDHGRIYWHDLVDDLWTGRPPYQTPLSEAPALPVVVAREEEEELPLAAK